jgi:glyoxylase-like metal-dependent hydrolase (beta-lactamase superfamily II)
MIHPERLLMSATRIYGDKMNSLWGAFEPCPAERVTTLDDGDEIRAGDRTLQVLFTPGHASHHIAYYDAERRSVFTGDVGGVRLQGALQVRPPTPPPDIDVEAWHVSVDRLRALEPRILDLTHFGRFTDPERHLDDLVTRLDDWTKWVAGRMAAGASPDTIASELRARSDAGVKEVANQPHMARAYELATPFRMAVDGLSRYVTMSKKR